MADCGSRAKAKKMKHPVAGCEQAISISYPEDPEQDYEVEDILDHDEPVPGQMLFRIKWKGYDESWNSWEPVNLLDNCPDKLREYKLKKGLPLTSSDATVKLTPVQAAAVGREPEPETADRTAKKKKIETRGRKKKGATVTARKTAVKRKLQMELPPATKTHTTVSQDRSVSSSQTSGSRVSSSSSCTKAEILEIMDDGTGRFMVSFQMPGRSQPALMWYQEMKDRYPNVVIDYFESHLKFEKSGGRNYVLIPPQ